MRSLIYIVKTQINVFYSTHPRLSKTDFSLSGVIDSPFGGNKDKFVLETSGIHSLSFRSKTYIYVKSFGEEPLLNFPESYYLTSY